MSNETISGSSPSIAILLAVYNPRMDWFAELLQSLDAQNYPNLRLYIRDDCSDRVSIEEIETAVSGNIKTVTWSLLRNEENIGSNLTFARLTAEAEGDYFAYCDQDDVWLPHKLSMLQRELERTNAELVCSDMNVVDAEGRFVADSITKVRHHHVFRSGEGLAAQLIVSNWITGCTMLVRAENAKASLPFCPYMVHDQYIALYCAEKGKIICLSDKLVNYRIHEGNQTLVMAGVTDRNSYLTLRIERMITCTEWLRDNFSCCGALQKSIDECCRWAKARKENWLGRGGAKTMLRYRYFSPLTSCFEMVIVHLPDFAFHMALELYRKSIL